ncbi:MAG TPA: D-aminoacylase [Acidobacteriota bacterium]|jgi:dihydroorotase/N-acyl-D-amino-acid deacylase
MKIRSLSLCLLFICAALFGQTGPPEYDILIRNGRILDGAGNPWFRGDVGIRAGIIEAVGLLDRAAARRTIDAAGHVVAPGFIDIHTHARRAILEVPTAENYMRQGVTTLIEGNDGSSPLPLKPFLDRLREKEISLNFGLFVGQGTVRERVMGSVNRAATAEELQKMKDLVRAAMEDGALGLSTGLFYVPGNFTPTEEVVELARVAGCLGGIYISHMRDETAGVLESVAETIAIGERGGLPAQITHHKIIGPKNWGRSVETLRLIENARARGVDVTLDQYPYTASSTGIASLLPQWAQEGGRDQILKRLSDPATRARIKAVVEENIRDNRGGGNPENIVISRCEWDTSLEGKSLARITRERGRAPSIPNAAETAMDIVTHGSAQGVFHAIDERDVERILKYPMTMVASDGEVTVPRRGAPHPRSYGTFTRVLGVYVREKHTLALEDAIRKMSSLPAQRIGLNGRGLLRPRMRADIVIFDPERVRDRATFASPHQYADGFTYVLVNGALVLDDGKVTAARPGQILLGPAARR